MTIRVVLDDDNATQPHVVSDDKVCCRRVRLGPVGADRPAEAKPQRDFYGIAEIAEALELNRQLVTAWRRRRSHGMPEPDAELAAGPLWRGESIEPWIGAVRARLTTGHGAPISPALVRRAVRRTLRLL